MPNKKRLILSNGIIQISIKSILLLIGLASTFLITKHFGSNGFGYYSVAVNYIAFFALFADWGVSTILQRDILKNEENHNLKHEFIANIISVKFIFIAITYIVSLIALFFMRYNQIEVKGILILIVAQSISGLSMIFFVIKASSLDTYTYFIGELIGRILSFLVIFITISYNLPIIYLFIAILINNIVIFIFGYFSCIRANKIYAAFNKKLVKKIVKESIFIGFVGAIGTIYFKIDALILSLMKSATEVGLYSLPYKILEILLFIPGVFMSYIVPQLSKIYSENDTEKIRVLSNLAIKLMSITVIPILVGTIVIAPKLIPLFGNNTFTNSNIYIYLFKTHIEANSVIALQILSFSILFTFFNYYLGGLFIIYSKFKVMMINNIISAVINIGLNILLIPHFTFVASAFLTVLGEGIFTVLYLLEIKHVLKLDINMLSVLYPIPAGVIMGIVTFYLLKQNVIVDILLSGVVYFALIILFRIVDVKELIIMFYKENG